MRLLFATIVVAISLASFTVESQNKQTNLHDLNEKFNAKGELASCANNFAFNFYKNASFAKKGNLIFMTFAIFTSINLAVWGARGETEKRICQSMNLPMNHRRTQIGYDVTRRKFEEMSTILDVSNKIIYGEDLILKSDWRRTVEGIYDVELHSLSYGVLGAMVFLNEGRFSCGLIAHKKSYPIIFTSLNGEVKITDTMRLTGKYRYGELSEIDARFVEIPCTGSNDSSTSMLIIMPNKPRGLENLERNIEKLSVTELLRAEKRDVDILLPRISFYGSSDVTEDLERMGLAEIFSQQANFNNIAQSVEIEQIADFCELSIYEIPGKPSVSPNGVGSAESIELTINHPFISIVTTTDEEPLILLIARYTDLE